MIAVEPRMKPSRWAVDPGLINPAWLWAWKGKVGHWVFWEGGGGKVIDLSGFRQNGTWNGTGNHWAPGRFGSVGRFNSSDDYVGYGNPAALQITGELTILCRIRKSVATSTDNKWVVSKDGTAGRSYFLAALGSDFFSNQFRFSVFKSNTENSVDSDSVATTDWQHFACVNDGNDLLIYRNAVLKNTNAGGGGAIDNDAVDFWIGSRDDGNSTRFFGGDVADVAIYNRALTANEIRLLYENPFADIRPWYETAAGVFVPAAAGHVPHRRRAAARYGIALL